MIFHTDEILTIEILEILLLTISGAGFRLSPE